MPWVGFDFDGTLARERTFEPIKPMVDRLRTYLRNGTECRILTARGNDPDGINLVKMWLREQGLPDLVVTSKKDYQMIILYDDRARQVIPNEGTVVGEEDDLQARPGEIFLPEKSNYRVNMKVNEALEEIEKIVRQIDPVQLFQTSLGHEMQNIVRKVRNDMKEEDVRQALGTRTF